MRSNLSAKNKLIKAQYVDKLYDSGDTKAAQEDADADIEAIIRSELNDTGDPKDPRLINVKMDEQCRMSKFI